MFEHLTPDTVDLIAKVLSALLGLFLLSLTRFTHNATLAAKAEKKQIQGKLSKDQFGLIESFVMWAVKAAEQMGLTGQLSAYGNVKKHWVIDQVKAFCDLHKISIDVDTVAALIEGSIRDGIHKGEDAYVEDTYLDDDDDDDRNLDEDDTQPLPPAPATPPSYAQLAGINTYVNPTLS